MATRKDGPLMCACVRVVQLRASVLPGEDTAAMKRQRAHLSARAAVEEDMMQRVQLSKEERRRLKGARRSALSGGAMLEDFADDVAGIVEARPSCILCYYMCQSNPTFGLIPLHHL
jgi:hypothetical protein